MIKAIEKKLEDVIYDGTCNVDYYDELIELSELYKEENDLNNAFRSLRKASQFTRFAACSYDYFEREYNLLFLYSDICLKEGKVLDYLYYYVSSYITTVIAPITSFPSALQLNYSKEIFASENGIINNDFLKNISKAKGVSFNVKDYLIEIYNFTFKGVLVKFDIPEVFIDNNYTLSGLPREIKKEYLSGVDYNMKGYDLSEITSFVSGLNKKYFINK